MLFLTATPHRGRKDTFRRLLQLLDEDLFQKDKHVIDRVQEQVSQYNMPIDTADENSIFRARNRFFLRRLKEEMVDWENQPLFKQRHTKTVGYELTPEEKVLYDSVTQYVRSKRKEAKAQKKRNVNVELTLMVMQRRLASSLYAITRTLENRLNALNEVLVILRDPRRTEAEKKRFLNITVEADDPRSMEEFEDLTDEEKVEIEKKIFRQVLTGDVAKIEEERDEVEKLYQLANSLKNHEEAKFSELRKVLDSSDVIRSDEEKLVIFTEHKDTMQSLAKKLEDRGYSVTVIHGGMDVDSRKHAQREFRKKTKIMVATDAAGEGINLQFCRYLINWDIPWNPNRLEQRMGRIHRYGQKDDVWVYNLGAQNTREGAVLQRVLSKLDIMRDQMGTDRVYDVIDEWLEGVPLAELMQKALDNDDATELTDTLNDATKEKAEALISLQKKTSLASRLNLRAAQELRDKSDERRLQPLFVQRFFKRAWVACGGTIRKDDHFPVWHIGRTPIALFDLASKRRVALSEHYDYPIIFDKQLVSIASKISIPDRTKLMGPGHPLFNILIEWAIVEAHHAFARGTILTDPNIGSPQKIWLTRSIIRDGREDRQKNIAHNQISLIALDHMGLRVTSPSYLLNCLPAEGGVDPGPEDRSSEEIQMYAYDEITEKLLVKVRNERTEECNVRRNYLNTAFQDLILDLQEELNDFQQQSLYGDDTADETEKLQKRIEELKQRKIDRMKELDLMLNLSGELPEILSQALVVPSPISVTVDRESSKGVPMKRDDEVEAIAMDVSIWYESTRGWNPVDVSKDGEHYDIRSDAPDGDKRFIEVKGRSETGAIILTGAELDKLRQLGSRAWLYVVTFCKSDKPRLRIIQDPIPKLNPEMLYRQVQFVVSESDWKSQGEDAE